MKHIVFNFAVGEALRQGCFRPTTADGIIFIYLPLEVGNIVVPESSAVNEKIYSVVYGDGVTVGFRQDLKKSFSKLANVKNSEDICFWVDLDEVKHHSNFAYFIQIFSEFQNKYIVEFDYDKFCNKEYSNLFELVSNRKPISQSTLAFLKAELFKVQRSSNVMFRAVEDGELVAVKDNYFDKYIYEFLSTKPKKCMKIASEIFETYGRYVITLEQVIIRMWQLFLEEKIERVETSTMYGLFLEYEYKISGTRGLSLG